MQLVSIALVYFGVHICDLCDQPDETKPCIFLDSNDKAQASPG